LSRTAANALLLLAGAIWGMGFVAQAAAMESIGPFLFVALRFAVASVVVLPFAWREARPARSRGADEVPVPPRAVTPGELARHALIGVALFGGMATQQVGLLTTSVTNSGFLTGLYVLFTPLLGIVLFREWPHVATWPAAALALGGIALLSGGGGGLATGDLLTIASAVFWGLQVVLIGRFVGRTGRPLLLSLVQFAVTASLAGIVAAVREPFVVALVREALPSILYAGVFASGLAFTLQVIGQRCTTAPQAAIFLSSEAPFAALFGRLLRDERIAASGFAGCAAILVAMLMVELVPMLLARNRRSRAVP